MRIRNGAPADAPAVLELFDGAVAWLVARGQDGQWGTRPFSAVDARVARAVEWAAGDGLRIACEDDAVIGAIVLGARPEHVSPAPAAERYIRALVTSRAHAGQDLGGALVRRAAEEARAAGLGLLRVDCWSGAPGLVAWFERQGFRRSGTFTVDGWHGQVLTLDLG